MLALTICNRTQLMALAFQQTVQAIVKTALNLEPFVKTAVIYDTMLSSLP